MYRDTQLRAGRRVASALLAGGLGFGLLPLLTSVNSGAAPTSVSTLRARAQQIANKIATSQAKLEILNEEYNQAATRASRLDRERRAGESAYNAAQSEVAKDTANLHNQAVAAYVDAGSSSGLGTAFSPSASKLPVQQTYMAAAAGTLSSAIATLHNSEITLKARKATLDLAQSQATANKNALASSRSDAYAIESQLQQAEASVTGNLRSAVRAAAAAAEARAQAAAAAAASSAQAASAAAGGASDGAITSVDTNTGSGSGGAAVSAAFTQTGVPYHWAGATPGVGFDCSGFTMWAWGRAGVNLPHSAAGQYSVVEHISYSQLQPGDLIFYSESGYIYHVSMYIGGGRMIEAENTGTVIHPSAMRGGAVGYGRP